MVAPYFRQPGSLGGPRMVHPLSSGLGTVGLTCQWGLAELSSDRQPLKGTRTAGYPMLRQANGPLFFSLFFFFFFLFFFLFFHSMFFS
ncbi:hypothetical protein BO94DRAFT_134698 [Aspergillus sclerotioniger CBS 115572]|uniref:Uncharacterized protein n=1 Tax=Aspergillus sclerotioniger CBS 115572 TaxID=1450535 RepID=A0A317XFA1_9EURO|nr:hypothetical protein BO94DRAFT_134698 [Aspergillus sclerotioniger CBS 115572]PWY95718.1 hypothetical protein BO94DRAFT_134698 [Aspergillus sclerotioniger CBS 115572]